MAAAASLPLVRQLPVCLLPSRSATRMRGSPAAAMKMREPWSSSASGPGAASRRMFSQCLLWVLSMMAI